MDVQTYGRLDVWTFRRFRRSWHHFKIILRIILGSFWHHVRIILGSFWDQFRVILGSFLDHFKDAQRHFYDGYHPTLRDDKRLSSDILETSLQHIRYNSYMYMYMYTVHVQCNAVIHTQLPCGTLQHVRYTCTCTCIPYMCNVMQFYMLRYLVGHYNMYGIHVHVHVYRTCAM